jgi:hypothetical protein
MEYSHDIMLCNDENLQLIKYKVVYLDKQELDDGHWNDNYVFVDDSKIALLANYENNSHIWTPKMWEQFNKAYPLFDKEKYNINKYCNRCCEYRCPRVGDCLEACINCNYPDRGHDRRINKINLKGGLQFASCINRLVYDKIYCNPCMSKNTLQFPKKINKFNNLGCN